MRLPQPERRHNTTSHSSPQAPEPLGDGPGSRFVPSGVRVNIIFFKVERFFGRGFLENRQKVQYRDVVFAAKFCELFLGEIGAFPTDLRLEGKKDEPKEDLLTPAFVCHPKKNFLIFLPSRTLKLMKNPGSIG